MPTKTTLLLSAFTLGTSLLAACGDDPGSQTPAGDANFSEMSTDEHEAAIQTALGGAAITPYFVYFAAEVDGLGKGGCPAYAEADGVVTLTGNGCTTEDGTTYDGVLVATNVPSFADAFEEEPTVDASRPMSIDMDQFTVNGVVYDGRFEQSSPLPANGTTYTSTVDYTVAGGPLAGSFSMEGECTQSDDAAAGNPCTGSGFIDTTLLGSYGFASDFRLGNESAAGWLELRGVDTLRVDYDASADGCAPYTIDGEAAGEVCRELPPEEPTVEITGAGSGCGDDGNGSFEYDLIAWIKGDIARVEVTMLEASTDTEETHPMTEDSYDAGAEEYTYKALIGDADTQFTCTEDLTYKFTAYDSEGASVCHTMGANPEIYVAEGCVSFSL